jgi:hypothetical protein
MKILYAFLIYGLGYIGFELIFNCIEEFLGSRLRLKERFRQIIRLKPNNSPSFWMMPVAGISCILIHFWLMLPFDYSNAWIILLTCIVGSCIITGMELASGLLLNVKLKMSLWNYDSKFNLMGQICLYRSIAWACLTLLIIIIDKILF